MESPNSTTLSGFSVVNAVIKKKAQKDRISLSFIRVGLGLDSVNAR
jgi:hypothetical protein